MMTMGPIKFVCNAVRWFDKVNGNTYHSVRIVRCKDSKLMTCAFQYGYGDQYRQTALAAMLKASWLPKKYTPDVLYRYERDNKYPILWDVKDGLKRDCKINGGG